MKDRWRVGIVFVLLAAGLALVAMDWPATLTDEDDYMPYALDDLLHGRNPYTTVHSETETIERPWGNETFSWTTAYPYLPGLAILQLPLVDYRITALLAYGLLLWALRDRGPRAFFAFANPLVLWLAASGFNDFVPLALLAWADRARLPALAALAAASKQLVVPLLLAEAAILRDWRRLVVPLGVGAALVLPFFLWDPRAFLHWAVVQHFDKVPDLYVFWNYLLYPLYLFAIPVQKGAGRREEEGVAA